MVCVFIQSTVISYTVKKNTHTQLLSEDELEKCTAWRHRMSLNVWVKLMDCFLLLCPWPLLLLLLIPSPAQPRFSPFPDLLQTLSSSCCWRLYLPFPTPFSGFGASGLGGTMCDTHLTTARCIHNKKTWLWQMGFCLVSTLKTQAQSNGVCVCLWICEFCFP